MKRSYAKFGLLLIVLLQACMPSKEIYYVPYGKGEIASRVGPNNVLTLVIDSKVIFDVCLHSDYGAGEFNGISLTAIFRVPDGVNIKLETGQFVLESESLTKPLIFNAHEFESYNQNTGKYVKYQISDTLHGYSIERRNLFFKETTHAWYRISLPIEQNDLSEITVKFPDVVIDGQLFRISPVKFERQVDTFWYSINR